MEVRIAENHSPVPQVTIYCQNADSDIFRLKKHIEAFDTKIYAKHQDQTIAVNTSDILYFDCADNRTFLYTTDAVMEVKQRLYELEQLFSAQDFVRISKSQIVNIHQVQSLRPQLNRTILATLFNGEQLCISRNYVKTVRNLLSV